MKAKVILATILILAASCVKNEVREVSMHGDGQILYNPAPLRSMTTKADLQTTKFPTNSTFGSCAWYLPGGNKWDDHHAAAATDPVAPTPYIPKTEISYNLVIPNDFNSGVWRNNDKSYYWPMNGSLTFISWAPYKLVEHTGFNVTREEGFKITNWKMENTPGYGIKTQATAGKSSETDPKVDILLSYTKDCTRNTANGKVPTIFSHLLCKVKVEARLANDKVEQKIIELVTLTNIYTKGDYVAGEWTNQSEPMNYVYPQPGETSPSPTITMTDKANTVIFPETMFLPQRLTREDITDRPKISIKLQGNETPIERYLYNDEILNSLSVWNQGKSITYVITIGNEEAVIDFAADVGGWEDGSPNIVPVQ